MTTKKNDMTALTDEQLDAVSGGFITVIGCTGPGRFTGIGTPLWFRSSHFLPLPLGWALRAIT